MDMLKIGKTSQMQENAAFLLHDVVEDTSISAQELPFPHEVQEIVDLISFSVPEGTTKEQAKKSYYEQIRENGKACVMKIIDRCNNVPTMSASFTLS